jgi:hypothetical protein
MPKKRIDEDERRSMRPQGYGDTKEVSKSEK